MITKEQLTQIPGKAFRAFGGLVIVGLVIVTLLCILSNVNGHTISSCEKKGGVEFWPRGGHICLKKDAILED